MKPSTALHEHRAEIKRIVERHRARNARVFGSALRGDDDDKSDLDLLVDPTDATTLLDLGAIQYEVSQLLGIDMGVLTPRALPDKWRDRVLGEARPL
jgi:hypothetical protein